jgi:hypothetical protein
MRPSSQHALAAMRFREQPPGSAFYLTPVEHFSARGSCPVVSRDWEGPRPKRVLAGAIS